MRPSTIYDYATLYAGDYMRTGWLQRAAGLARMLRPEWDIVEVGAGRGDLANAMATLGYRWTAYDVVSSEIVQPGQLPILRRSIPHHRYDCSVTIDVLEHIPEADIIETLADLRHIAPRGVWAVANTSDIGKVAGVEVELHLTRRAPAWWLFIVKELGGAGVCHTIDDSRFWLEVTW